MDKYFNIRIQPEVSNELKSGETFYFVVEGDQKLDNGQKIILASEHDESGFSVYAEATVTDGTNKFYQGVFTGTGNSLLMDRTVLNKIALVEDE